MRARVCVAERYPSHSPQYLPEADRVSALSVSSMFRNPNFRASLHIYQDYLKHGQLLDPPRPLPNTTSEIKVESDTTLSMLPDPALQLHNVHTVASEQLVPQGPVFHSGSNLLNSIHYLSTGSQGSLAPATTSGSTQGDGLFKEIPLHTFLADSKNFAYVSDLADLSDSVCNLSLLPASQNSTTCMSPYSFTGS